MNKITTYKELLSILDNYINEINELNKQILIINNILIKHKHHLEK